MLSNKLRTLLINAFATITSTPNLITGDVTGETLLSPPAGKRINIRGLTLAIEDGQTVYIKGGTTGTVYLPIYGNNFNKAGTSNDLNIKLETDEELVVDITGSSGKETFIGIS